ncbi:MAG: galactose mutarotase [Bacteroidia bacterium]
MKREPFLTLPDGRVAEVFTLVSDRGCTARITNYGGIVVSIMAPDMAGRMDDVVLGYDDPQGYLRNEAYMGCVVGRFANRIRNGRFALDGQTYTLARNLGEHHLHGGVRGFDKVLWEATIDTFEGYPSLLLRHTSPDGDEGYPGTLQVELRYSFGTKNSLWIDYRATTDVPTIVNLTNHTYFNLRGFGHILDHELLLDSRSFCDTDEDLIPTGDYIPVSRTPMDFTYQRCIGDVIDEDYLPLRQAGGFDHCFVKGIWNGELVNIATVYEPYTRRKMEVLTTEPCFQLYTGNWLDNIPGKNGETYGRYSGLCIEAQRHPDAPNRPTFPSTRLDPGQVYEQTTVYRFGTYG